MKRAPITAVLPYILAALLLIIASVGALLWGLMAILEALW